MLKMGIKGSAGFAVDLFWQAIAMRAVQKYDATFFLTLELDAWLRSLIRFNVDLWAILS